jgi:uncharacterized membrane protein
VSAPAPSSGRPANPNLIAAIAYFGGLITGAVVLVMEKQDRFVRFHAMQSVVVFVAVLVLHLVLAGLPLLGVVLYLPFLITVIAIWVMLMTKAWRGETYKLPYLGDLAEQLLK